MQLTSGFCKAHIFSFLYILSATNPLAGAFVWQNLDWGKKKDTRPEPCCPTVPEAASTRGGQRYCSLGAESFPQVFWCVTKVISAACPKERAGPWGRCYSWWGLTLDFQPQSLGVADQVGKGAGKRLRNSVVCMNGHENHPSNPLR